VLGSRPDPLPPIVLLLYVVPDDSVNVSVLVKLMVASGCFSFRVISMVCVVANCLNSFNSLMTSFNCFVASLLNFIVPNI